MRISKSQFWGLIVLASFLLFISFGFSNGFEINSQFPYFGKPKSEFDFKLFGAMLGALSFVFNLVKVLIASYKRLQGLNVTHEIRRNGEEYDLSIELLNSDNLEINIIDISLIGYRVAKKEEDYPKLLPNTSEKIILTLKRNMSIKEKKNLFSKQELKIVYNLSGVTGKQIKIVKLKL